MKNIITHLTALSSRGAFRSALAAMVLTGASLLPASAATRVNTPVGPCWEYTGTMTAKIRKSTDWSISYTKTYTARVRIYDNGRVTASAVNGYLKEGSVCIDTFSDSWLPSGGGWQLMSAGNGGSVYTKQFKAPTLTTDPALFAANTAMSMQGPTSQLLNPNSPNIYNYSTTLAVGDLNPGTTLMLLFMNGGVSLGCYGPQTSSNTLLGMSNFTPPYVGGYVEYVQVSAF